MPSSDEPKKANPSSHQTEAGNNNLEGLGMDELLSLYSKSTLTEGEIVTGRVLKVTPTDVVVDVGAKSEGLLPVTEVTGHDGTVRVKRGDDIEVFIERLEDPSGYVILSRDKAARMRVWDDIEAAFKAEQPITGRIIERVKGGLSVDVGGVKAFLPGSLVDSKPIKNLDSLKGLENKFKIVSFDKKRNNIVLSRRAVVEVEQQHQKAETFSRLEEGKPTHGVVKNLTDYGVFVDLGGVDGLLHITDISWGRVGHPSEYFNVGDEIEVMVLKFDP
ncbi:MAG TPA: S1 RNA-binding domain-containing protein, partial [Thermoanaerobaculia bacterium]|nr:S1 RNA-binding domain-containing protein [Thermoanaerobaculia bacterium]